MLLLRGSVVTFDVGLIAFGELDDPLGLTARVRELFTVVRTGKNGNHALVGFLSFCSIARLLGLTDVAVLN
jgi:hypothetical protein